jgi:hypothetical protein
LARELASAGRRPEGFPNALSTMWTWIAKDRRDGDRMLVGTLAPLLGREADELRG